MASGSDEKKLKEIVYSELIGYQPEIKSYNLTRIILIISVVAMVVGVIGLNALAPHMPIVELSIKDIGPQGENPFLNYATIRVRGEVVSVPSVSVTQGRISLFFTISDGSGSIDVRAYDPVASQMIKTGKVPLPGDTFIGEVQVRVRENYAYLIIQGLELFEIRTKSTEPVEVKRLSLDIPQGTLAKATGRAVNLRNVSAGWLFELDTGVDRVTVLIPRFLIIIDEARARWIYGNLTSGSVFTISGVVYHYRGTSPEIVPRRIEDIVIVSAPTVKPPSEEQVVKLGILENFVGSTVVVEARIKGMGYYSGQPYPYAIYIYDDTGEAIVRANSTYALRINPKETGMNSTIRVTGVVKYYDETLVIEATNLEVLEKKQPIILNIGEIISNFDKYNTWLVGIRGKAESWRQTSGGSVVIDGFSDETGSIMVFIPRGTWDRIDQQLKDKITGGEEVTLYGYLTLYQGRPELVVYNAYGVEG